MAEPEPEPTRFLNLSSATVLPHARREYPCFSVLVLAAACCTQNIGETAECQNGDNTASI